MKKVILITLSLISINAFADDAMMQQYEQNQFQQQQLQNQQQMLKNQQTQMMIEQSAEQSQQDDAYRAINRY